MIRSKGEYILTTENGARSSKFPDQAIPTAFGGSWFSDPSFHLLQGPYACRQKRKWFHSYGLHKDLWHCLKLERGNAEIWRWNHIKFCNSHWLEQTFWHNSTYSSFCKIPNIPVYALKFLSLPVHASLSTVLRIKGFWSYPNTVIFQSCHISLHRDILI